MWRNRNKEKAIATTTKSSARKFKRQAYIIGSTAFSLYAQRNENQNSELQKINPSNLQDRTRSWPERNAFWEKPNPKYFFLSSKRFFSSMCLTFKRMKNTNKKQPHCKSGRHDSFMFFFDCVSNSLSLRVCSPQFQVTTYARKKTPLTHTLLQTQQEQKTCTALYTIPFIRRNTVLCACACKCEWAFAWIWLKQTEWMCNEMYQHECCCSLYACNVLVDIAWTRAILTAYCAAHTHRTLCTPSHWCVCHFQNEPFRLFSFFDFYSRTKQSIWSDVV